MPHFPFGEDGTRDDEGPEECTPCLAMGGRILVGGDERVKKTLPWMAKNANGLAVTSLEREKSAERRMKNREVSEKSWVPRVSVAQ